MSPRVLRRPRTSQRGATSVEYALVAALIALVVVGSVTLFGGSTAGLFQRSCSSMAAHGVSC
jgi:pilus assembly protein Flp/PilA